MNRKAKGIGGERELIHLFWKAGWAAIRVAGSGAIKYPAPDIVAGNSVRRVVVECKVSADTAVYLTHREVNELRIFAEKLAAEPWVGVRFSGEKWLFLGPEELTKTGASYVANRTMGSLRGLSFEELTRE